MEKNTSYNCGHIDMFSHWCALAGSFHIDTAINNDDFAIPPVARVMGTSLVLSARLLMASPPSGSQHPRAVEETSLLHV